MTGHPRLRPLRRRLAVLGPATVVGVGAMALSAFLLDAPPSQERRPRAAIQPRVSWRAPMLVAAPVTALHATERSTVASESAPVASSPVASSPPASSTVPDVREKSSGALANVVLAPGTFTAGARFVVTGRVARAEEKTRWIEGAEVTLHLIDWDDEGREPLTASALARLMAAIPVEGRASLEEVGRRSPRPRLTDLGPIMSGPDGRYSLTLDRALLPRRFWLGASARIELDGEVLAGLVDGADVSLGEEGEEEREELHLDRIGLGRVRRIPILVRSGGHAVADALLKIHERNDLEALTDARGVYVLETTGSGASVYLSMPGLARRGVEVDDETKGPVVLDLDSEADLAVRVVGPDGAPVQGGSWSVSQNGFEVDSGNLDGAGRALAHGLAPGVRCTVQVVPEDEALAPASSGASPEEGSTTVHVGRAGVLVVTFQVDPELPRRLRDAIPVSCSVQRLDETGVWQGVTGGNLSGNLPPDGTWRYGHLEAGVYRVSTSEERSERIAFAFSPPTSVAPGERSHLLLAIGRGRGVTGWCVDEDGGPVSARVICSDTGAEFPTEGQGCLDLRLPPSEVHLLVTADGRQPVALTVQPSSDYLGEVHLRPLAQGSCASR
jgi:hypothetical protein